MSDVTGRLLADKPVCWSQSKMEHMLAFARYLRIIGARPVPYRAKINNVQIEADTLEEIVALIQSAAGIDNGAPKPKPGNGFSGFFPFIWTPSTVLRFMNEVGSNGKQFTVLHELETNDFEGVLKDDLTKTLGISAQQLGGILSGITKNAKKLNCGTVFQVERLEVKGKRTCRYSLDSGFRDALEVLKIDFEKANDSEKIAPLSARNTGGAK